MSQDPDDPLYDRQSQTETLRTVALGIADLVEFVPDALYMLGRDAYSGVPHLDAQPVPARQAIDQNPSALRITHGVLHEVADDAGEQDTVAANPRLRRNDHEPDALAFGDRRISHRDMIEQHADREILHHRADRPGVQP